MIERPSQSTRTGSPRRGRGATIALLVAAMPVGLVLATLEPVGNPVDRFDGRPASTRAADRDRPPRRERAVATPRPRGAAGSPSTPSTPSAAAPDDSRTQRRKHRTARRHGAGATPAIESRPSDAAEATAHGDAGRD